MLHDIRNVTYISDVEMEVTWMRLPIGQLLLLCPISFSHVSQNLHLANHW